MFTESASHSKVRMRSPLPVAEIPKAHCVVTSAPPALTDGDSRPPPLTTAQAADYLQVSVRTVKGLLSDGQIAYVKIGRTTRIHIEDLDYFVAQNRRKYRTRLQGK
jgi:excisionase family DNA binding protein